MGLRDDLDSSAWGYTSRYQPITEAFGTDPTARGFQDVGFDGLSDSDEFRWKVAQAETYVERLANTFGAGLAWIENTKQDPAGDNFQYFRGDDLDNEDADILARYKRFNSHRAIPTPKR